MSIQHGQLRYAAEIAEQAVERLEQSEGVPAPIAGPVYGSLGVVYYEWNRLDEAGGLIARSASLSQLSGHTAGSAYNKMLSARLMQAGGDLPGSALAIQEAVELLQVGAPAWLKPEVIHQQVRVHLAHDSPLAAEAALKAYGINKAEDCDPRPPSEPLCLAYLRLRLHQARYRPGLAEPSHPDLQAEINLSSRLIESSTPRRQLGIALEAHLLRAQLRRAAEDQAGSMEDLERALRLGEEQYFLRTFLDEGPELVGLLQEWLEKQDKKPTGLSKYANTLLSAFGIPPAGVGAEAALIEALTERELAVLELMAEGLKYGEIAERLVVTINTVRFHVKGIYGKLNVNNRTQALESARQAGLL